MKILVTGATGKVGSEVAKLLLHKDVEVVIGGRDERKVREFFNDGFEYRYFDAYKPETYDALTGIERMFLLGTEGKESVEYWKKIIDTAASKNIKHIVFLSSLGAEFTVDRPQRLIELYLQQSGMTTTILRPNFFFQNFSTDDVASIRMGKISLPCGNWKTSFVDTRDIAAIAVQSLLSSQPVTSTINITGSESLDYFEVAAIFSSVLNKEVTYENPSEEEYEKELVSEGTSEASVKSILWLYESVREGRWSIISNDFKNVVHRNPVLLRDFVSEYKEVWM